MSCDTKLFFTSDACDALEKFLPRLHADKVFLLYPEPLATLLLPNLGIDLASSGIHPIAHAPGEQNKDLGAAAKIWEHLLENGATRKSILINLGGGMTCDLGGFAAACYMRSIPYINIPTTLLAYVDAACGGKTAVNLKGVKNIVGAFQMPAATIISTQFLASLPAAELLSGWAEMLKHALLTDLKTFERYLATDPFTITQEEWLKLIQESVFLKKQITDADPKEIGLRRILNLGHTVGHAIEAISNTSASATPLSHGHAVAIGLITALILSNIKFGFDSGIIHNAANRVKSLYPAFPLHCTEYDTLLELMHHDKKNRDSDSVSFVLLNHTGQPLESVSVSDEEIRNALDITRDLLGL